MAAIRLARQAAKDLDGIGDQRGRVERFLRDLAKEPRPANPDILALRGRAPWSRARVGTLRLLLRALNADEVRSLVTAETQGYLISRVIHRRDLNRIVQRL